VVTFQPPYRTIPARDGDGIREKDGTPARFTLLSRSPPRSVLVQEYLRRVGLEADILSADLSLQKQRLIDGDFDAAIQVVQDNTAWLQFFFGDSSATGYANPRVGELFRKAVTTRPWGRSSNATCRSFSCNHGP
jgi:ABC-type oligopeptide transport system substrate-binding subunit